MAATEHKYSQRTFSTLSFCWHNRQTPTYRLRDYEFMECLGTEDHFPLSNLKVLIEQRRSSYGFWNGCGCAVFLSEINFAKAINCWYREQWNSMLLTTQSIRLKRAHTIETFSFHLEARPLESSLQKDFVSRHKPLGEMISIMKHTL